MGTVPGAPGAPETVRTRAYTDGMALDIAAVQAALIEDGLDGWLLYAFHSPNPIARSVAGLNASRKMTTRRWYYMVPATGEPRALVHAIEPSTLDSLPGPQDLYPRSQALAPGPAARRRR